MKKMFKRTIAMTLIKNRLLSMTAACFFIIEYLFI